jgi:splicing factor 3B subunit 2
VQLKEKKPGVLSPELIAALGMQDGAPPPWLINMQRYGPPPSYTHLLIPGLNAPLPPGASYGYQPGGWGKPPVDEYGRPLYGDVFGMAATAEVDNGPEVDKEFRWGNLETEEFEETDEEEEEEEDLEELEDSSRGRSTKNGFESASGLDTPSTLDGTSSMISGMETPDTIDIRKRAGLETPDISVQGQGNRELYQVVKEKKASAAGSGQLFGSDRLYVLPGKSDVQISFNPDELDDLVKNKERLKEAHDAQIAQQDLMFKHMNYNRSTTSHTDGMETEDRMKGSKKRKADQTTVLRKMKEFKF